MGNRIRCLWLFLALASAWAEDFVPALSLPTQMAASQDEVYPIALRYRTDLQADLEMTPAAVMKLPVPPLSLGAYSLIHPGLQETIPQVFSSADLCHTLMSIQW
jgi:hypothetical protein